MAVKPKMRRRRGGRLAEKVASDVDSRRGGRWHGHMGGGQRCRDVGGSWGGKTAATGSRGGETAMVGSRGGETATAGS